MLSHIYRQLTRWAETAQDPVHRPAASALSRRTFARILGVVAFGGLVPPAPRRVVASQFCSCDAVGQCSGSCVPRHGPCAAYAGTPLGSSAGSNCWCEPHDGWTNHVCDCQCSGSGMATYCECNTLNSPECNGAGGGGGGRLPGVLY